MIDFHKSVLVDTVTNYLVTQKDVFLIDATLGDGGHSEALLESASEGQVLAFDLDQAAIARAKKRLDRFGKRFIAIHRNFTHLRQVLDELGIDQIDGLLADLGVSYAEITKPERGFSYQMPGPLLMKMDSTSNFDAATVINSYSFEKLWHIIRDFGEERFAKRIAGEIVDARKKQQISTTNELSEIIKKCVPRQYFIKSCARVFQAFRIEVNNELENLRQLLPIALDSLKIGGRLAIISYHSLEDRIVKQFFREQINPCTCPPTYPYCVCEKKPRIKMLERLIRPSELEIKQNSSARSAKLRIAEKII